VWPQRGGRAQAYRLPWLGAVVLAGALLSGCVEAPLAESPPEEPFTSHPEASDFDPLPTEDGKADGAVAARFDPQRLMAENFYLATDVLDGDALQAFFEETPYGTRCWLADETIGEQRVADALVDVAHRVGINPIVLLARMQVEKSLVSAVGRPGRQHDVDFALGCGCHDGRNCQERFRGLDRQVECGATTLSELHAESVAGTGAWRVGRSRQTLDGHTIRPANHATAALYAYTPWVLSGRGGNWLVWNVTRRFARAFAAAGVLDLDDPRLSDPFVGTPCAHDAECLFEAGGGHGFCLQLALEPDEDDDPDGDPQRPDGDGRPAAVGFCSLRCEGYCPDLSGHAPTFCTSLDGATGLCLPQAAAPDPECEGVPLTAPGPAERFVGDSGAPARAAQVCLPLQ